MPSVVFYDIVDVIIVSGGIRIEFVRPRAKEAVLASASPFGAIVGRVGALGGKLHLEYPTSFVCPVVAIVVIGRLETLATGSACCSFDRELPAIPVRICNGVDLLAFHEEAVVLVLRDDDVGVDNRSQ